MPFKSRFFRQPNMCEYVRICAGGEEWQGDQMSSWKIAQNVA
jgi:hypothetical protein